MTEPLKFWFARAPSASASVPLLDRLYMVNNRDFLNQHPTAEAVYSKLRFSDENPKQKRRTLALIGAVLGIPISKAKAILRTRKPAFLSIRLRAGPAD